MSPVPRSSDAPSSSGRLVTTSAATPVRAGRSLPERSSNAPAAAKSSSGDANAAAPLRCASVSATSTAEPLPAAPDSDAPASWTGPEEPVALRISMRPRWTSLDVLTGSSNVMRSMPRSWFSSALTTPGSSVSDPDASRTISTPSSWNPVTAAYVEPLAVNVATPLAPSSSYRCMLSCLLYSVRPGCISVGSLMSMICTPLHTWPLTVSCRSSFIAGSRFAPSSHAVSA